MDPMGRAIDDYHKEKTGIPYLLMYLQFFRKSTKNT